MRWLGESLEARHIPFPPLELFEQWHRCVCAIPQKRPEHRSDGTATKVNKHKIQWGRPSGTSNCNPILQLENVLEILCKLKQS